MGRVGRLAPPEVADKRAKYSHVAADDTMELEADTDPLILSLQRHLSISKHVEPDFCKHKLRNWPMFARTGPLSNHVAGHRSSGQIMHRKAVQCHPHPGASCTDVYERSKSGRPAVNDRLRRAHPHESGDLAVAAKASDWGCFTTRRIRDKHELHSGLCWPSETYENPSHTGRIVLTNMHLLCKLAHHLRNLCPASHINAARARRCRLAPRLHKLELIPTPSPCSSTLSWDALYPSCRNLGLAGARTLLPKPPGEEPMPSHYGEGGGMSAANPRRVCWDSSPSNLNHPCRRGARPADHFANVCRPRSAAMRYFPICAQRGRTGGMSVSEGRARDAIGVSGRVGLTLEPLSPEL